MYQTNLLDIFLCKILTISSVSTFNFSTALNFDILLIKVPLKHVNKCNRLEVLLLHFQVEHLSLY